MKTTAIFVATVLTAGSVSAETLIGSDGITWTSTAGSTQFVLPAGSVPGTSGQGPQPVFTAPDTGSRTYVTPDGTYQVSRSGSTTFVIQTSRGSARK